LIVLEAGRRLSGKNGSGSKRWLIHWVRRDDAEFVVGEERGLWSDHFARESDLMLLHCGAAEVDSRSFENVTLHLHYNRLSIGEESFSLDQVDRISGVVHELEIPREAMGRGDLKFLAAIGAFLGWPAIPLALFFASLTGAVVGLIDVAGAGRENPV
jgi:leader peptidase (prepilin peptidase)/N-methyltransferase